MAGLTLRRLISYVGYEIDPKAEGTLRQYAKMGTDAQKQLGVAVRDVNGRLRDAKGRFIGAGKGAKEASGGVSSLTESLGGFKTIAAGVVGGLLVGAFHSFVGAIFEANREFETLNASLVTVTGSEEAAGEAFKRLEGFAARTPYSLGEVVGAFNKLKALGLDPSEAALESYGNTASAMGKTLNDMIEAVADASTGEFERLKEFGIKSKSEGNKVSFTFQGMTTTVGKNAAEIEAYLRKIGDEPFAGGMARQAKTLGGQLSTLKDNVGGFFREIGKSGFNDAVRELFGALNDGAPDATSGARVLGKVLGELIRSVTRGVKWVNANLTPALTSASKAVEANITPVLALAKAFALLALPAGFVFLLLEDLYTYLSGGDSLIGDALGGLESAGGNFTLLAQAIKGGLQVLKGFGLQLAAIFSGQAVGGPLGTFVNLVRSVFGMFRSEGPSSLQTLFTFARPLLDNLARIFLQVRGVVVRVFDAFTTVAAPAFRLLWAVAKPILKLLILWFGFIGFATLTLWGLIWDNFLSPLLDGLAELLGFVARVAAGWMELWVPAFETIYGWVEKLIDAVFELLGIDLGPLNKLFGAVDAAFGVDGGGAKAQTAPLLAAGAGGGKGAINAPTTVGSVTVQVQGTTDMGPAQLAAATEAGVRKGLPPAQNLRNIQ